MYKDCFGNCKTSLLPKDVGFAEGKALETKFGSLPCIRRLADVPDNEAAIIIGSSGCGDKRLLELVIQGDSAAKRFGISIGARIF